MRRVILAAIAGTVLLTGCLNSKNLPDGYRVTPTLQNGTASPGLWRTLGSVTPPNIYGIASCGWLRTSALLPPGTDVLTSPDVIAHEWDGPTGPQYVEIKPTDIGFYTQGCFPWWQDGGPFSRPLATPGQPFGPGEFKVGDEVAPGTYHVEGQLNGRNPCIFQRLSGWSGEPSDVIQDFWGWGLSTVTIEATDIGVRSNNCGTFTPVASP